MPTIDDALKFIVSCLRDPQHIGNYGYEVYISNITSKYAHEVEKVSPGDPGGLQRRSHQLFSIFCEAAWELSRRGILRPGIKEPHAQETPEGANGGGYMVTTAGRTWLKEAEHMEFISVEPSRFAQIIGAFRTDFGDGFLQRSQEASKCYFATAYLSCCVMCGAATESILLRLAIEREKDEEKVMKTYNSSGGRGRIEMMLIGGSPDPIKKRFLALTDILKYWRDDASHGTFSDISEFEAHEALTRLLRFANFAKDNWKELTTV